MIIQELSIKNFRNILNLTFRPRGGINLLIGDNGQGKSNLLEALGLIASGRSFRTSRDRDLIHWESSFSRLDSSVLLKGDDMALSLLLTRENARHVTKRLNINGSPVKKLSTCIDLLKTVTFSRHDIEIVVGAPEYRRRFLDHILSSINTRYLGILQRYMTLVRERNSWLRSRSYREDSPLDAVWREQLADHGSYLIHQRLSMLEEFSRTASESYGIITSARGSIVMRYQGSFPLSGSDPPVIRQDLLKAMERHQQSEKIRRVTMTGPHRDDFSLMLDEKPLRLYGSQGQQRMAAMALKLAGGALIEKKTERPPLLILDDCFSELDTSHQNELWALLHSHGQVFISSNAVPVSSPGDCGIYRIREGKIDNDV